ncbi:NEQ405 [Nanoarchaeum equitans Kin4-M]|uniref:NEQ405 n=1 Tax=Nanoarchaeum equitans (strain Kin4-M) TaxID=228908 RepID=Q74ME8_NANEQ|nr:NEQ405 [Nanoarchaeum equitans Kin4-M]
MIKKKTLPNVGEYIVAKIIKIDPAAAIAEPLEYEADAILPFNEVARGRIKDIKDHVRVGQIVVGKVIRVDPLSKTIYFSLRKAHPQEVKRKLSEFRMEQAANKILELLANKLNEDYEAIRKKVAEPILKKEVSLYKAFLEIAKNPELLKKYRIPKKYAEPLLEIIKERIKPKKYEIKALIELYTIETDGINRIRKIFEEIENLGFEAKYQGSGKYYIRIEGEDPKELERKLKTINDIIEKYIGNGEYAITRIE